MTTDSHRTGRSHQKSRRILISGSTGFIGRALVASLRRSGHLVVPLLRGPVTAGGLRWNPGSGSLNSLDPHQVSGFDTVIHLAGEPVVGLWTSAKKRRILESRVLGTTELVTALAAAPQPPGLFLCASGINFYGNRGETILDEASPLGEGFLASVCAAWEEASKPLVGISQVLNPRIGVVLDLNGGMLAKMLPLFRLGLGAIVGGGRGYLSWITLRDLTRIVDHLIESSNLQGPLNVVAPEPVTVSDFSKTLASALNRPIFLRIPGWPFRLLLGQLAEETILGSIRAVPERLLQDGFRFEDATLDHALAALDSHPRKS